MRALVFLWLTLGMSPWASAGWYIGNGGDAIYCHPSPINALNGYYSIDYLLTLASTSGPDGITPATSWEESAQRLQRVLDAKVPGLADSFRDFKRLVYNTSFTEKRVWEAAPFGLTDLNDERITARLPENCKTDGAYKIVQAVIRQFEGFSGTNRGHYIYKYVPELLHELDQKAPVQMSFLMVHEWLWDVSANVDRNRRINRFLHSQAIESMTPEEVTATLTGMGLPIPGQPADAFDARQWQGYLMTPEKFFERYPNPSTLGNLGQLKVDFRQRLMNCNSSHCDPNWRNTGFGNITLEQNRFFLSPAWNSSQSRDYPIRIMSPEIMNRERRIFGNPEAAEIACKFVVAETHNLECHYVNPTLVWVTTGIYTHDTTSGDYPTLYATITEESFRLVIPGRRRVEVFGTENRQEVWETETVFTLRFRWPGVATFNSAADSIACDRRLTGEPYVKFNSSPRAAFSSSARLLN